MVHRSGIIVADLGMITTRRGQEPLTPRNEFVGVKKAVTLTSGWIISARWNNNTGNPVSLFQTTWIVPPEPTTDSEQTIFLFSGMQNKDDSSDKWICQPVLQWGSSAAGGGSYWAVASWYIHKVGQGFYSQLVRVNPGDVLVGIMALTRRALNSFDYTCRFHGFVSSELQIQNVEELKYCKLALEAYKVTKCSDYPDTNLTAFRNIDIYGDTVPLLNWEPVNKVTSCGQHAVIVSNANPGGEVDLFYRVPTAWSDVLGWSDVTNYSTIQTAVVNNELYLLARANAGMHTWNFNAGNNIWTHLAANSPAWSDNKGWADVTNYSTIQTAVVNNELYLLARANAGMHSWKFNTGNNTWIHHIFIVVLPISIYFHLLQIILNAF